MTLAVHHIALNAHDPQALARLAAKGAGFRPLDASGAVRWIAAPNAFVALHATAVPVGGAARARRVCDPGITHFCVQAADGDALWRRLDAAGLAFNAKPVALGTGAIYAYGRDPECNVIEIEGIGDGDAAAAPWIAHVALASPDLDRLADFYARLIGRDPHHEGTFRDRLFKEITGLADVEVCAKWIMADNLIVEMWRYLNPPTLAAPTPPDDAPGYRHIGFACDDLPCETARLAKRGIALGDAAPVDGLPARGARDPDGNRIVIVETPPRGHRLALAGLDNPDVVTNRNRALLAR